MGMTADPREFVGKRVLVSGGTKGLGRATVERFLAGGARVITAARTIRDKIDGVDYVEADLTTAAGGETLANAAMSGWTGSISSPMSSAVHLRPAAALLH